ncbi:hypothetical protein [Paraburkholderia domus]|uniref:hypothetical protein n=1 Tax=Paraburkholderia domus TaxID=2793075 RepID=UPI001913C6FD|nr:hypothetical protein [Paraburkholderia domus]MBK5064860.1 hypothetical protein [Burkholderia sp. R-70199]CAE6967699.1 hypothetical protein R70199_07874 [Paraburkholderia domus]
MSIIRNTSDQSFKVFFNARTNGMLTGPSWVQVDDGRALAQQVEHLAELVHDHYLTEVHRHFTEFQWGPQNSTGNVALDTERLVVGHGFFGIEAALDESGGKFESDAIDNAAFVAAVAACTDAILYFPASEAQALRAELEANVGAAGVTSATATLVDLVLKHARPTSRSIGFPFEINTLSEAVSLVAERENVSVDGTEIAAICSALSPGNEDVKLYRQHAQMWRVCRNCMTARGNHTWSSGLFEMLCVEPNEEERPDGVVELGL